MRQISFTLTTEQVRQRLKTVTRRYGFKDLKPGTLLQGVVKSQGLRKGEHPEKLSVIRALSVRREPLNAITAEDVAREGFPGKSPEWFINFYCEHNWGTHPGDEITRIEFDYVD
jgi:hypothetical protein